MLVRARHFVLAVFTSSILFACSDSSFIPPQVPVLSNDASLSDLTISSGVLLPFFQTGVKNYTASVGYLQTDISVTAMTTNAGATIVINSAPIPLAEGLNTITVTVTAQDTTTIDSYTIDITRGSANSFAQQAYVKASNTDSGDSFGQAIALYGNTMAVGARAEDSASTGVNADQSDNSADDAGAVYVFVRDEAGTWSQQAYIKASNTDLGDIMGGPSIALYENTLAIGARLEDSASTGVNADQSDNSASDSGAVYVFTRDEAGTWTQQANIKASNTDAGDDFGRSFSLYDNTLAVGARFEASSAAGVNGDQSDNSANRAGATYVFTRDQDGAWSQQAYIKASNSEAGDLFGGRVSIYENILAVGARGESSAGTGINADQLDNSALSAGAVYVFVRDQNDVWTQQAYIKASNTDAGDDFGFSVSIYEKTLAVSARLEDSAGTGLNADQSDNSAIDAGAVYVFTSDAAGIWSQQAYIKASNTETLDDFSRSISLYNDSLAVGARGENSASTGVNADQLDNSANDAGAVYLFTRDATGSWSQTFYLKASNAESEDFFRSATIFGGTLAVGAEGEDSSTSGVNGSEIDNASPDSGAVYVFE